MATSDDRAPDADDPHHAAPATTVTVAPAERTPPGRGPGHRHRARRHRDHRRPAVPLPLRAVGRQAPLRRHPQARRLLGPRRPPDLPDPLSAHFGPDRARSGQRRSGTTPNTTPPDASVPVCMPWAVASGRTQAPRASEQRQHALAEPVELLQVRVAGEDELVDPDRRRTPRSGRRPRRGCRPARCRRRRGRGRPRPRGWATTSRSSREPPCSSSIRRWPSDSAGAAWPGPGRSPRRGSRRAARSACRPGGGGRVAADHVEADAEADLAAALGRGRADRARSSRRPRRAARPR